MNRYLVWSVILHAVLAGGFIYSSTHAAAEKKKNAAYTIDFLGASFQSVGSPDAPAGGEQPPEPEKKDPEPASPPAPPPPDPAARKEYAGKEEISVKAKKDPPKKTAPPKRVVLDAPSILTDEPKKGSGTGTAGTGSAAGEKGAAGLKTDFSNFPYPWYITQVRNSLWTQWEKRRPGRTDVKALVSFAIQKDGSIKNAKIAESSKDEAYDYAALSSVTNAAPFPALPKDFDKSELTVSVEYRDII
ncbi:protein TonB [Parelusimicrobium proximum]|uniref:TonB family protein n=1 Tax=Parelusimicrobium proximum TaxID=3228953 RepID=UPI003D16E11D